MPPLIPTDISVGLTTTTATVFFTIPFVVYDSEQYRVNYGLSMDALDQLSQSIASIDGDDQDYMIEIENLQPSVTYFFQITSTNSIATITTGIISGTTMEDGNHNCISMLITESLCPLHAHVHSTKWATPEFHSICGEHYTDFFMAAAS